MLARFALAVDDLSGGRLQFGLGAGWQAREHHNFSYDLLSVRGRMDRFAEGLEIIVHLLRNDSPLTFEGRYYKVHDAVLLPRPVRPSGPPIVVGGNGPKRTLPLVARFADEWNALFMTGQAFRERNTLLDEMILAAGRKPGDVRRSMMTGSIFGKSKKDLDLRLEKRKRTLVEARNLGLGAGYAAYILSAPRGSSGLTCPKRPPTVFQCA